QRKHFRPKQRTEIGGVLYIHDTKQGYVAIQRKEGEVTCFLEDGTEEGEAWWSAYLSGLTKEMYTAIYSFSAQDLMDIQHMNKKRGQKPLLKQQINKTDQLYKQLSVEQAKEATYYELKITKEEKEKELENLQNSIENLQWETQKQEKIKQNIADIHYLYQAN